MHIYFVMIILASTCICSQGGNFNPLGLFPCQCCQSVWCLCIPYLFSNIFCTVWFPYLHSQRFWQMIRRRRNYDFDIPTHERCFFCKRFLSLVQFSHNTIFNEIEISKHVWKGGRRNMCLYLHKYNDKSWQIHFEGEKERAHTLDRVPPRTGLGPGQQRPMIGEYAWWSWGSWW